MTIRRKTPTVAATFMAACLGTSALTPAGALAAPPAAESVQDFRISAQSLQSALLEFSRQSQSPVVASTSLIQGLEAPAVEGRMDEARALETLLAGTDLYASRGADGGWAISRRAVQDPQGGSAATGGATVEALIVTAQKREEDIQDVPIAISAFSQEDLTRSQIAGGPDLMTQVPNMTFTKTNFGGYSIQIRGIGTQAISATVDPAVAVAFNNTPFIRNRFFEQEFYDLQRVEVLRGPQGTLYGRNATAGVVNLITARPVNFLEGRVSADVANYSSHRLEGMLNLPLVEDAVALRLAGAWTKRDGYVTNSLKGEQTDGRDLWSVRATLGFEPTDDFRAYLTYEHFEEDDDRLRSGKQLCTRDEGRFPGQGGLAVFSFFSQGCKMGSLYSAEAFQVPNGFGLPYYAPLRSAGLPFDNTVDPYASTTQSRDLRSIETSIEPVYKAKTDIIHLAMEFDLTDSLTLTSETGYTADELFSFNDYNRFNTASGVFFPNIGPALERGVIDENGVFCDPQLGCADRLVAADVFTGRSDQFSQEFRLSSDFDGPFNFHLGANFLRFDTVDKYYVFINSLSMYTALFTSGDGTVVPKWPGNVITSAPNCTRGFEITDPNNVRAADALDTCMYIDPNPINSLNDYGRNYFLSKNPFRLISYAVFGEAVYNFTPDLKITAGLRFTVDKKRAPIHPSWLLGRQTYGLAVKEIIDQEWREPTGRLVVDWKPQLGFTDETLVYASYARGYKAGGVNPPLPAALPILGDFGPDITVAQFFDQIQPPEFGPEFVDAFELGSKNTLLDGRLTLNGSLFYYDYEGYQISQIANRSAVNLNFDAEVWGAELELDWRPLENLKIGFRGGYEKTRVGDGQSVIDLMDRTAGDLDWVVRRPFPSIPSNCIIPAFMVVDFDFRMECDAYLTPDIDPLTRLPYVPNPTVRLISGAIVPLESPRFDDYPGFHPATAPAGGAGIAKDVGGNELPNAPDFTTTLSVDYTLPLQNEWLLTLHADLYRQSEAWTRIYNEDPYDKLKPFEQVNLAAIFTNDAAGWKVMAYVKNALDKDNITGAFLNSDDSGLTTNVFLNEPRLYGLRVTKEWTGQAWWTGGALRRHEHYPFRVEIGAGALRAEADNAIFEPTWADEFTSPNLPYPLDIQDEDLDWGDSREVKLTYAPSGGVWNVALGARFGRTNGVSGSYNWEPTTGGYFFTDEFLALFPPYADNNKYVEGEPNWTNASHRDREEHTIIDFSVGRELGIGGLQRSMVALGLQYAQFDSESQSELHGRPDSYTPDGSAELSTGLPFSLLFCETPPPFYDPAACARTHIYHAEMEAERSFEGTGPVLSWDASRTLLGNDDTGRLALDWSLSAGVLFGKQEARAEWTEDARYYRWMAGDTDGRNPGQSISTVRGFDPNFPADIHTESAIHRSDDVTVPTFGASFGLSYSIDRVKIGAGYRWDRYQDAIEGGLEEAEQVDRDIHGPFLKLSVGFGG